MAQQVGKLVGSREEIANQRAGVQALLSPRSVAVIGASDGTRISGIIVTLLVRHGFAGPVYPINPKYDEVQGLRCYPDVAAVPADQPIDVAIVYVSSAQICDVIRQCGDRGVKGLVVITAGFAEIGSEGAALQDEMVRVAGSYEMAMSGPNCAGIANFGHDYLAYGTTNFIDLQTVIKGEIALLTASGGFGNTIFTYCQERSLGLSHIVGLGNEAMTNSAQFLDVLVDDDAVALILANIESIRDPAAFFAAADRAADAGKPVVVLKGGRSAAGQHAIATHTAALGGSPAAFAGAFKQHGIVQVTDLDELADVAMLLTRSGPVTGDRLGIFSLAGGGAGLLADLGADFGFVVPEIDAATADDLLEILPPLAVVKNPLDPTAGFGRDAERLEAALGAFAADPNIDVVVFFPLASQASFADQLARTLIAAKESMTKPVIVIWTAGQNLAAGAWRTLHEAGVPLFTSSTAAFRALRYARGFYDFQQQRHLPEAAIRGARTTPAVAGASNRQQLEQFGLRFPAGRIVTTAADATAAVAELGTSALKVSASEILHKTEAGGVRLGVATPSGASHAFEDIMASCRRYAPDAVIEGVEVQQMVAPGLELLLGVHTDDQLGPILTVGLGGVFTELVRDVAQRPVPVSELDARLMLDDLKAAAVFDGFRGGPRYDKSAVIAAMLGLSAFADETRDRAPEVELNPLVVHERGAVAVDLVLHLRPADDGMTA